MKEFAGVLCDPIPELTQHDVFNEERRAELLREKAAREEALIRHFGYRPGEPDVWYKVALSLAELVVPAYRPPRGRPKTSDLRVQGWACLWTTLRQTGTKTDTAAFETISAVVGADTKTVRARLTAFRRTRPEAFAEIERHYMDEIGVVGAETALRYAKGQVLSDPFDFWFEQDLIRKVQGRAPSPYFATINERIEFAERQKY
ncbi:MAG: hypothetical protein GC146_00925 [Limimaricola sp.]|uniref:hypothetical protein n=1 Tax=Limimaricola sp. TaxID=2211665 RepID=UPI001D41CE27|nr:hypothetical protein [Limimaricola sp.]MBI1415760.1 hypothetical protein [Limimaricola sp.]